MPPCAQRKPTPEFSAAAAAARFPAVPPSPIALDLRGCVAANEWSDHLSCCLCVVLEVVRRCCPMPSQTGPESSDQDNTGLLLVSFRCSMTDGC
mmetsp:Transcript_105698/g.178560  ORF Transcript_105698/g.178560 Transcript_105698/m.178560 type:complete len:94 (-) Transcript_105698:284-565(-)